MLTLEEACAALKEFTNKIIETETCSIEDVLGRIFAEDVVAPHDQPPFPRSPFDGYAIRSEDSKDANKEHPAVLTVIGEVDAGGWFEGTVSAGEAVRIMTGAPIPAGTDAVIKQEETDYGEEIVKIYREMRRDQNYIFPGEDYKKGSVLLEKGEYIGPVEAGILASAGCTEVKVIRRPRMVVISTGDELMYPGEALRQGKIYDSNLYTVKNQIREWGAEVMLTDHVPDDAAKAVGMIRDCADSDRYPDIIITSGGVSVGKKDIMHEVFEMLGIEPIFWKVGMKPGASMLAGKYNNTLILALSGNPYAAYVDLHMLVRPVISNMTGCTRLDMIRGEAVLANDYNRKSPVRRFLRAYVQCGKAYIEGHTGGNGDVTSGRHINALIDIPAGSDELKEGETVSVMML